jgi:hypothetical protein
MSLLLMVVAKVKVRLALCGLEIISVAHVIVWCSGTSI